MYQTQPFGERINSFIRNPSALPRIILLNCIVWLLISISRVVAFLFNSEGFPAELVWMTSLQSWLSVPASLSSWISRPWTIFTYMFLHLDFWHLFFNMIWLYWFGKIFTEFRTGKNLITLYIIGGIVGAIVFMLAYNLFPAFSQVAVLAKALGASASVLAIVVATAVMVPNYSVNLLFIGSVKIKYIALFTIVMDILMIPSGNAGGHFAHLGGAFAGALYIKSGKYSAISKPFSQFGKWFRFRPANKFKTVYNSGNRPYTDEEYNQLRAQSQKKVDLILDKIAKSGYKSLSEEEKEFLFKYSNKQ